MILLLLIPILFFTAFNTATLTLGRYKSKELLLNHPLIKTINWDYIYLYISFPKNILILLALSCGIFLLTPSQIVFLTLTLAALDLITRILAVSWPKITLLISSYPTTIFSLPFFPINYLITKALKIISRNWKKNSGEKTLEIIQEAGLNKVLDNSNQKLLASIITFREKVAREIMIPRVDIFALNANESIKEASKLFLNENYSRIPVYKNNLDNIIGILMYKDILHLILQNDNNLENSIEQFVKPVLYTPENKKIATLFQEFKNKHIHIAIIVNEYGGTEGIVTIEDILEEIVGEIEDEYDIGSERQFKEIDKNYFLIDAKMSIVDIENKLGIRIPHHPEYETIGGFLSHKAGSIPVKGWTILQDDIHIEVISSNDRSVEKVKIKLIQKESVAKEFSIN